MGARHGHDVFAFGQVAEHLRTLLDREAAVAEVAELAVLLGYGGGVDHDRVGRVGECGGDEPHVVFVVDRRPFAGQLAGQAGLGAVVSGHAFAFVQEIAGQGAHADAADA